jgi:hypothetical protein
MPGFRNFRDALQSMAISVASPATPTPEEPPVEPMTITDAIRHADSEHMVYFLLNAYTETLQFAATLPARLTRLPLSGARDIAVRLQQFVAMRDHASTRLDERARLVIKEAVDIFAAGLRRLNWLMQGKPALLATAK